jgi:outer membrane immunogenic protein
MVAALGSAAAADLQLPAQVYKAPPPPPVYRWTGCYLGGGGGYGAWTQNTATETNPGNVVLSPTTSSGGKGWFAQGQVGCDYEFAAPILFNNHVVIGAFADYEYAGNGFSGNMNILQVFSNFGAEQMPWAWAAGARAGILATPRFLVYLDGGYTQANFSRVDILFGANGTPQGFFTPSNTYNGWFLGSGFEYSFDWLPISGLFLKTEYRFSTFNTANLPIIANNGAVSADAVRSSIFTQLISTELVWRLNWSGR